MSIYKLNKCTLDLIVTPRYSSPYSPLTSRQFAKLQQCIKLSNDLLRSLGNPQAPHNLREFQLKLKSLKGKYVSVSVACENREESVAGVVVAAGKDYLQLSVKGAFTYILYAKIMTMKVNKYKCIRSKQAPALTDLSKQKRRALTLNFGDIVSGNPTLLNMFFGIPLTTVLLSYLHSRIQIKGEAGECISGTLMNTTESEISLQLDSTGHLKKYKLNEICIVRMNNA